MEEPKHWVNLMGKSIWPDRLLYNQDDLTGKTEIMFVIDKGNNRALTAERSMMVRVLEQAGLQVYLSMGGQLLTLDQFNQGQGYRTSILASARQQVYNARHDLARLEQMLEYTSDPDRRAAIERTILNKKRLIDSATLVPAVDPELRAKANQIQLEMPPEKQKFDYRDKQIYKLKEWRDRMIQLGVPENEAHVLQQQTLDDAWGANVDKFKMFDEKSWTLAFTFLSVKEEEIAKRRAELLARTTTPASDAAVSPDNGQTANSPTTDRDDSSRTTAIDDGGKR